MHYVLFYPDEFRAKSMGCYGNPCVKTPNLDRLAREGVLFERNYTQHPVCVAARCSLMTGWYPHVAGFRTLLHFMRPHHPNFLRYIKNAGYQVHWYGKNHVFSRAVFEECVDFSSHAKFGHLSNDPDHPDFKKFQAESIAPDYTLLNPPLPDSALEEMDDTVCVANAVRAIRGYQPGDPPLFIFLPTLYPHTPYTVPEPYYHMYDPDALPPCLPAELPHKPGYQRLIRQYRKLRHADPKVFQKIQAVYLGMCSYTDMLLGRVLDALEETGLAKDTTVIAASDHGDWAGDYGLVEKWPNAFEDDLTRVPLIIRTPGCAQGHRVKECTETFDIMPTLCDLAQIPVLHDQFGRSLRAQLFGAPGDPNRTVYCEGGYDRREPHCFEGTKEHYLVLLDPRTNQYPKMIQQQNDPESVARGVMLRTSRHKLCVRTSGDADSELYDMEQDPDELCNLYGKPEYEALRNSLEKRMLEWMIHTSDVVPWEGHREP